MGRLGRARRSAQIGYQLLAAAMMSNTRKDVITLTVLGLVFITLPVFFQRLHSDEVIFWEVAKNIAAGAGPLSETHEGTFFILHMPLPFLINALFLKISPHIFMARAVASLFTTGCAVLIYMAASKRSGRGESLMGALFFLFSFQMLRYGGRFYLDQFGAVFFVASIYLIFLRRHAAAGFFALLAMLSREYWVAVYPFLAVYVMRQGDGPKGALRFVLPGAAAVVLFVPIVMSTGIGADVVGQMYRSAIAKNILASLTGHSAGEVVAKLGRAWAEFLILNLILAAGVAVAAWKDRSLLLLIVPQIILTSLAHGFMVDGGVTQYPIGLLATVSIFSGTGIKRLSGVLIPDGRFVKAGLAVVFSQFVALNILATAVSLHGNVSIYGLGYSDDRKVIEILRREARGEYIHGIWGAFVEDRMRWDWTDYLIQDAIDKDPDWLITYENYVDVNPEKKLENICNIYKIGPYVMIHSLHGAPIGEVVRQKGFNRWALRRG